MNSELRGGAYNRTTKREPRQSEDGDIEVCVHTSLTYVSISFPVKDRSRGTKGEIGNC